MRRDLDAVDLQLVEIIDLAGNAEGGADHEPHEGPTRRRPRDIDMEEAAVERLAAADREKAKVVPIVADEEAGRPIRDRLAFRPYAETPAGETSERSQQGERHRDPLRVAIAVATPFPVEDHGGIDADR